MCGYLLHDAYQYLLFHSLSFQLVAWNEDQPGIDTVCVLVQAIKNQSNQELKSNTIILLRIRTLLFRKTEMKIWKLIKGFNLVDSVKEIVQELLVMRLDSV